MSSALCFNLDQSKILSSGNGLVTCIYPTTIDLFVEEQLTLTGLLRLVLPQLQYTIQDFQNNLLNSQWQCLQQIPNKTDFFLFSFEFLINLFDDILS